MSEISPIFVFTTKTTQPRPQVFSVNGALTCKEADLFTSSVDYFQIWSSYSSWLWWIVRVLLANQNWENILNES